MSDRDVRKLAKIVADHSRQIKGLSGGPQAAYSSIEGGSMDSYDSDGKLRLRIGAQDDGTQGVKYVQGPPPPRPTAPVVSVDGPVVRVRWDGMLLGGHIPEDFARIDVHFALASDDLEDASAVRGNLATTAGNETVLAATQTGTYRVGLVAMSQSRARSEMSETVDVEVELVDLKGALDAVVDNARGGSNYYSPTKPPGTDHDPDRDLWFDTSQDEDGLTHYTPHRWDEDLQDWISLEDERTQAIQDAQDALASDIDGVRDSANGKNQVTWSTSGPPTQYDGVVDDVWFTMSGYGSGARVQSQWRWNGDVWVSTILSAAVLAQIDIGAGTFGELDGIRLKVGSVAADRVLVGGALNLVPGLEPGTNRGMSSFAWDEAERALRVEGRQTLYADDAGFWLSPGEYLVESEMKSSAPTRAYIGLLGLGGSWNYRYGISNAQVGPEWQKFSAPLSIPESEGPALVRFRLLPAYSGDASATTWFRNPTLRPMVGGTLIEPDSISTPHIRAGTITAESGIVGSLDAGVITVGEMNGARIEAGTIDTPQLAFGAATGDILSVDALDFKTARGLDIRSSSVRAGDSVEITEDFGIRQFGPDGALNVSLPSDGSEAQFRGDLSARTLTATGRMSVQGPGAVASGGVLELESGVVPPISAPQVSQWWASTSMPPVGDGESVSGLVWADGHWWRGVQVTGATRDNNVRARVEKITATGELVSSFSTAFGIRINGITYLDGLLYVLGAVVGGAVDNRYVVAYNLTGTEQHRWEYLSYGTGTYQPGIGVIGSNIAIAQCWASGELSWRIYRPTDGYQINRVDRDGNPASDIVSINLAEYDLGTPRIVLGVSRQTNASMQVLVYTNSITNPVWVSEESWYAADYAAIRGLAWDGSLFHTLQPNGDLAQYEPNEAGRFLGDNDSDWRIAIGWASDDGSRATPAGPPSAPFRFLRRARRRTTIGDTPEGVERARFYYAKTLGEVSRTDLHYVSHASAGSSSAWTGSIVADWASRPNPPEVNSFVADKPGEIRSATGNFRVDGSGAGQWGPLEFRSDGTVRGMQKTATGRATIDATADTPSRVTVTFPQGRFTSPPVVQVTPYSSVPGTVVQGVSVTAVTATSVDLVLTRTNTVTTTVHWLAIADEEA